MPKKEPLPEVKIRFEQATDEGVALLVGTGTLDRKDSGVYIVKVYGESGALLKVPGATRPRFQFRCYDLAKAKDKTQEEFDKYIKAAAKELKASESW